MNRNLLAALYAILPFAFLVCTSSARAIVIDGSENDWGVVSELPLAADTQPHDSPLGAIRSMKLTQDDDFVFVYIEFAEPRPFADSRRQKDLVANVWDNFTYLEIDVNGDGQPDYRTRMEPGKRFGMNNLCVLQLKNATDPGTILLYGEGNKDYFPLGPRAFFNSTARAVEQRIPRVPLAFKEGRIFLRGCVTYCDKVRGTGNWVTEFYPQGGSWIALDLRPIVRPVLGEPQELTPNRALEPVLRREQLGPIRETDSKRLMSTYVYPRPTPAPFVPKKSRNADSSDDERLPATLKPAVVVGPGGEVTQPLTAPQNEPEANPQPAPPPAAPSPAAGKPPQNLVPIPTPAPTSPTKSAPASTPKPAPQKK